MYCKIMMELVIWIGLNNKHQPVSLKHPSFRREQNTHKNGKSREK
jgi:hypothetical protein